jgi:dipeptidyl aminopeptidase/acylaminoacyl peptidase
VIYPGEFHQIRKPSYERDRLQRYLDWYGRHLQPRPAEAATH